jgi:hypothetical protein
MVKGALVNDKDLRALFPTMCENSLKDQKTTLRPATGVSKWGLGSGFPPFRKGIEVRG